MKFGKNSYRYGRSPEWVRMCVVTLELCEKRRSQIGHRNGFWPVCRFAQLKMCGKYEVK